MDFIWRVSGQLSSLLAQFVAGNTEPVDLLPISRERRSASLAHCLRYPSPYRSELVQCLKQIAPDTEMVLSAGYCLTDLFDLQLGLPELKEVGFSTSQLIKMDLTDEMRRPMSLYAPMFRGFEGWASDDVGEDNYEEYYL